MVVTASLISEDYLLVERVKVQSLVMILRRLAGVYFYIAIGFRGFEVYSVSLLMLSNFFATL